MPVLFILFIIVPILEISVLIQVGGIIGGFNTLILVLLSAALGSYFVKREGVSALQSAQAKMAQNQLPAKELLNGALLILAGVMLITPGFLTDILGLSLVIPLTRKLYAAILVKKLSAHFVQANGQAQGGFHQSYQQQTPPSDHNGDVFEGEYSEKSHRKSIELDNSEDENNEK